MEKLYNKFRYSAINEIVGNLPHVIKIKNDIKNNQIDHAYLFYGDHGTGKTSMARLLSSYLPDVWIDEINASVDGGVEAIRNLVRDANIIPIGYKTRLIIFDEIQRISASAFDSLLKPTEESGESTYFILITTEFNKIPNNIKSRFTKVEFKSPSMKETRGLLEGICQSEGITISPFILSKICKKNSNNPRDCISDLQLIMNIEDGGDQVALLESYIDNDKSGYDLAVALTNKQNWSKISKILKEYKENEVEGIRRVVCNYMKKVLLDNGDERISDILNSFSRPFEEPGLANLVLACYDSCK